MNMDKEEIAKIVAAVGQGNFGELVKIACVMEERGGRLNPHIFWGGSFRCALKMRAAHLADLFTAMRAAALLCDMDTFGESSTRICSALGLSVFDGQGERLDDPAGIKSAVNRWMESDDSPTSNLMMIKVFADLVGVSPVTELDVLRVLVKQDIQGVDETKPEYTDKPMLYVLVQQSYASVVITLAGMMPLSGRRTTLFNMLECSRLSRE